MFEGELDDKMEEREDAMEDRRPQLIEAVEAIQTYLSELAERLASELENADGQLA